MSLVERLSHALRQRSFMLVTVESCTGGMIAEAITALPGSSEIFERGFITYSNQAKMDLLGVRQDTLANHGAVSETTASEMATGALIKSPAQAAISVTGIAGPGGGSPDKPVGLVYIGVALKGQTTQTFRHIFEGDRTSIRKQSADASLSHLLDMLEISKA